MTNEQGPNKMNLENRKAGRRETRPTPETDAALADRNSSVAVDADFARTLERQRDEAVRQARYGWERSAEKDAAYGKALAQRDRLLEALKRVLASATPNPRDNPAMYPAWESARDAIAEIEGSAS